MRTRLPSSRQPKVVGRVGRRAPADSTITDLPSDLQAALAEIVGDGRPWTVLMISELSMSWRWMLVIPWPTQCGERAAGGRIPLWVLRRRSAKPNDGPWRPGRLTVPNVYSQSLRRTRRAIVARVTRSPEPEPSRVESSTWPSRSAAVSPVAARQMALVLRQPLRLERPGRPQRHRTWAPHALGAAAYAAKARGLAAPERPEVIRHEVGWQLASMSDEVRAALRKLPPVGHNRSGPLGPGLLASGILGAIIRDLQAGLAAPSC
jgi:hypothetical protein